jgi:hypothetical protein
LEFGYCPKPRFGLTVRGRVPKQRLERAFVTRST